MTVDVAGSLLYIFKWYDGATVKAGPDFNDVNYVNRDLGPYTVTATDPVTGCVSPPSTAIVQDKRVTPEFTLASTPSFCADSGRDPVGSLMLTLTTSNVFLEDVLWRPLGSSQVVGSGVQVFGLYGKSYL